LSRRFSAFNSSAPTIIAAVTAVRSNLVSNVPAVLVLKPFVASMNDPQRAWLVVVMASTPAGNFTLLGRCQSDCRELARADGITISFRDYFKIGAAPGRPRRRGPRLYKRALFTLRRNRSF
jgi:Na+/H+ antiporter NhaD/arsenite permease-like protein